MWSRYNIAYVNGKRVNRGKWQTHQIFIWRIYIIFFLIYFIFYAPASISCRRIWVFYVFIIRPSSSSLVLRFSSRTKRLSVIFVSFFFLRISPSFYVQHITIVFFCVAWDEETIFQFLQRLYYGTGRKCYYRYDDKIYPKMFSIR